MSANILSTPVTMYVVYIWVLCVGVDASISTLTSALHGVGSLFEYHTNELIQNEDDGFIAAFGNYNGDEFVDIFVITNKSQTLDVLLANENKPYTRKSLLHISEAVITSVVPTDFNGDAQMDIILVTRPLGNSVTSFNVSVYWGNHTTETLDTHVILLESFQDEPLLFDFNGDMYPDLLAETSPGVRKVWLSNATATFLTPPIDFPSSTGTNATEKPFFFPQSHAFVDMDNNFLPDLVLTTVDGYELWLNEDGVFRLNMTYSHPPRDGYIGQSTYTDLDQDKLMDQLVPVCIDKECTQSAVFIRTRGQWIELMGPDDLVHKEHNWNFVPPERNVFREHTNQSFPVMLRTTDYNLDGYPDAIVLMRNTSSAGDVQQLFLLKNLPCKGDLCDTYSRTFGLEPVQGENTDNNAMVGTFYDIYEDGTPDVVMVTMLRDPIEEIYSPHLVMLKNEDEVALESCFIKVTVASGLCYKDCPDSNQPYGVNYPGPTVSYRTTKTTGKTQESAGTQLSQTAHFALQTPYQTFGLGGTPNFIEDLHVAIPNPPKKTLRDRSWPFIIPNSQLIVIPHPPSKPSSWMLKLFITPSQLVYLTGAALLGTCGFVAGIVGVLQWREKREDKLEKKQESQKFHFDAM